MKFEETVIKQGLTCPKCGEKTLIKSIAKEPSQSNKGRWFVAHCKNPECDYWTSGFT